jgi:hypothetical protein
MEYIATCVCVVTTDGLWIGELDLLTACTHDSELQATASNSGDSSASSAHVVTVRQYPAT